MEEQINTPTNKNPEILPEEKQLFVPIEVDALFLTNNEVEKRRFAKPVADFSKLPYIFENERHNSDTANISEDIITKPFEESVPLEKGVHLFWELPDFLKHGYSVEESNLHFFPLVPDCWLVTRFVADNQNSPYNKTWLVKSSSLSQKGKGITVLSEKEAKIPFKYIGKKIEIDTASLFATDESYNLTALGYGDPAFSALYTNCRNVFGMHDDLSDIADASNINLSYHVCGWYAHSDDDVLFLNRAKNIKDSNYDPSIIKAGMELPFSTFEKIKTLMLEKAGVDSGFNSDLRIFCNGGITNINQNKAETIDNYVFDDLKLYIGNSEEEAIACLLAHQKSEIPDKNLEKLLNAFQLGLIQKIDHIDGAKVIDEELHKNRFISDPGEKIWIVRSNDSGDNEAVSDKQVSTSIQISATSSALLEQLNKNEQTAHFLESKLESLRFQVFCDWYKFMIIHYSDDVIEVKQTPDDDKLRSLIIYKSTRIQKLEKDIADIQKLIDNNKSDLENALKSEATSNLIIKQISGPRFWKPKEPVLLFFSETFTKLKKESESINISLPVVEAISNKLMPVFDSLALLNTKDFKDRNFFSQYRGNQFRKPLLMDWEATCYNSQRNSNDSAEFYDPDFLINQYDLNEFDAELAANDNKRYISHFTHNGTSILSDSGGVNLKQQLESLDIKIDKDDSFFDKIFAQSISGFNDELLMYKSTAQLPVADPMGESTYLRRFTDYIAGIVGTNNTKSPQPQNHFSPIREGIMQINRIRFTDHFGQVSELPVRPENISVSSTLASEFEQGHFYLPPRIVQSSRLHFRWCSSQDKTKEAVIGSANSPVLGWVLHDKMDNTLTFYHPTGEMLCELKDNRGKIEIIGSNGRRNTYGEPIENILKDANPHLTDLIMGVLSADNKPMYRFVENELQKSEPLPYFQCIIDQIDLALANINPKSEESANISMLFGKPLAIVRASLDFQLKEYPAANYSWEKTSNLLKWDDARLVSMMDNEVLDREFSDGFCDVKLPVKLGDFNKQNDSLVLYFREKSGKTDFTSFRANEGNSFFTLNKDVAEDYNLNFSVNSPVEYLTMLVYPVGAVHAVTGVLPVKSIDLPSEYYQEFLKNFEISFRIGPVLTNRMDEAFFATYKPVANNATFAIFKSEVEQVQNYLNVKEYKTNIELIRYLENLNPDYLEKFRPLLLPRKIYLANTFDNAKQILEEAISSIDKMVVYIEKLLKSGTTDMVSFDKLGLPAETNMQMENVAKSYFGIQKTSYLLSSSEWNGVQAKFFEKNKVKIESEICDLIEIEMLDIPFASIESAQTHISKLLEEKIIPADLIELIIKYGKEPEAAMFVPAPKAEAQSWSFLCYSENRIDEFQLKDNNSAEQFDLENVTAADGWLLLKNKG